MGKQPIRIGVIGLGNMGKHHVRNYALFPDIKLVAICDTNPLLVKKFSVQYHCKGYRDLNAMLKNEQLDAVSITVPTQYHYSITRTCLDHNLDVLVEKPICDRLDDAQMLINLAEQRGRILMVGHIERFNPAVLKLKSLIDSQAIGKITSIIAKRVGASPPQVNEANVVIDLAVHDIDIFSFLLDRQPTKVHASGGRALHSNREDYAEIFLTYGDQNCFIQVNWITPIRIRNLAVTGTKGYIELDYITQELVIYESNFSTDFNSFGDYIIKFGLPNKHKIKVDKQEPLYLELSHFITCVRHRRPPVCGGDVGYQALAIARDAMVEMKDSHLVDCVSKFKSS